MTTLLAVMGSLMLAAFLITTPVARHREAARRDRKIERRPGQANLGDVRRRLASELPPAQVAFVWVAIDRHRLDAATLWAWLDERGAAALVLVLAAGHRHAALTGILRGETAYDARESALLAQGSEPELFRAA